MSRWEERSGQDSGFGSSGRQHLSSILRRLETDGDPSAREALKRMFLVEEGQVRSLAEKAAIVQSFADEYAQKRERAAALATDRAEQNGSAFGALARIVDLDLFLRDRASLLTNSLNGIA